MALNAAPNNTDNQANNNIQDNQPPTSILLPPDINLPITIQYLFVPQQNQTNTHQLQNHNSVLKNTPLFNYYNGQNNRSIRKDCVSVNHNQIINNLESVPDIKTYKSPIKGELIKWLIIKGQVLHEHDGWRTCPIVSIKEPCTHAVQWHGQCAISRGDCAGISENSRASVPMLHGPSTLTVSVNEAERLENETRNRLSKAGKLSLIVDLDQTIVHETVDPTFVEWMFDPSNPNWKALQKSPRIGDINGAFLPPTQLLKPAPIEAELPPSSSSSSSSSSSATVVVPITDPQVAEV
ncbi:hypothetical protein H4Q26_010498 [Puccinia striiformis f. sp. tritici PST-130]|nr:hypothetical protein H4Q26_010498 [Puccinia striiformis f. sp. tritici PST-130]